jgi:membrane associated rhomboid family serine protease
MPPLTPLVKKLIVSLLAAFVLELVLQNFAGINVIGLLSLDPNNLDFLTPLRLVSYVFIEDPRQVMSMLINLVFMWLILSPFEVTFGSRHTLELALCGTVVAGITVIIVALLAPVPGYMFFGSHPIAYAGMAAMTQVIRGGRIMFFGVIPMTSQTLLLVLGGLSLLQFLATKDHLMLTGSLGAMAAGIGYVRYMARPPRASKPRRSGNDPRGPRFRVLRGGGGGGSSSDGDSDRPKWLN